MDQYLEVAVYRLKSDVTPEQFLRAADANLADFQRVDGFVRRELARSDDGQWLDVVYYTSREAAQAAEPLLSATPSIQAIMDMLEMAEGQWFHATPTRHYV
jgi:hypothetical protein